MKAKESALFAFATPKKKTFEVAKLSPFVWTVQRTKPISGSLDPLAATQSVLLAREKGFILTVDG